MYPYRRFSSEMYAAQLAELLDEHGITYEIVSEPEGAGSVFLGAATVPGVVVMVSTQDVKRISELEQQLTPQHHAAPKEPETEEPVDTMWFILGYIFAVAGAPIAIIAGLHLFSARRRNRDFSSRYAYDHRARFHGRLIFWFGLSILLFSMARMMMGARMSFLDTISFAAWSISHAL
jgi:hypothetical protein